MAARVKPTVESHLLLAPARSGSTELAAARKGSGSLWWLAWCLAMVLALPGCRGCSDASIEEDPAAAEAKDKEKKKDDLAKKERPKPDFDPVKLRVVPQKAEPAVIHPIKPGHWTAAIEETKANNFNFVGQLFAEVRRESLGGPIELDRTPHWLTVTRPTALAKGQPKFFELMFFVPRSSTVGWLNTELRSRGGSSVATTQNQEKLKYMEAHQYYLVVLGAEADRYRALERLDSVRAPHSSSDLDLQGGLNYYEVVAPALKKPLPLPSNVLAWTSIAYVIWDDVDPSLLSAEQQQALVDWLHMGGQLIISGPKSLDQLRGKTFLSPYLPAVPGEPLMISAETLAPLSQRWTLPVSTSEGEQPGRQLTPVNPWSGVELIPQLDGQVLDDTANLVVERRVGRGRIVTTAFRLTQRELWNWPGFDGFFNACLLRRPSRSFTDGGSVRWANAARQIRDPLLVTQVRILSRDWNGEGEFTAGVREASQPAQADPQNVSPYITRRRLSRPVPSDTRHDGPGVAGWNDFSPMANAARESLREAAGIVIPKADFVIWVLALYLIILVPVNWLAFWGLGRVEWAWVAAPVIAVGGMAAVVKLAQLDIGFARSQTEIGVLELHNGYPRGHLTRYTALYTSLSTTYDASAADRTAVMLPFAASADPNVQLPTGRSSEGVTYHCEPDVKLTDFSVRSNSTSMLHSEQMIDLGGAIEYKESAQANRAELVNRTKHPLTRAAVVRRVKPDVYEIAWVGEVAAGRGTELTFRPPDPDSIKDTLAKWSFTLTDEGDEAGPKFSLDRLADLLRGPKQLQEGEVRLLAMIEKPLDGLTVDPAASQSGRGATLVVATLRPPDLDPPEKDRNSRLNGTDTPPSELPEEDARDPQA